MATVTQISEPSFDEMMNDPIIRALMAADGVDPRELQQLLRLIAENLRWRKLRTVNQRRHSRRPSRNLLRKKEMMNAD